MHRLSPESNFAIFVLFFGVAALDTLRAHDWLGAAFWVAIGLVFLRASLSRGSPGVDPERSGTAAERIASGSREP